MEPYVMAAHNRAYVEGRAKQMPTRLLVSSLWVISLLAILITLGVGTAFGARVTWKNTTAIRERGLTTQAQINDVYQDSENNNIYYARYTLTIPGTDNTVTNHQRISRATYEALEEGAYADVRYLPENPTTNQLASDFYRPWGMIDIAVLTNAAIVIVIVLAYGLARRRLRLYTQGQLVMGQITRVSKRTLEKSKNIEITVHYRFTTPDNGISLTGKKSKTVGEHMPKNAPKEGQPVGIQYVHHNFYDLL